MSVNTAVGDWLGLRGRVCVVTGAAGGLGSQIARDLASIGASVLLMDREKDLCEPIGREIEEMGGKAVCASADVTRRDAVEAAAARCLETLGPCDVLINNAAVTGRSPVMDLQVQDLHRILDINLGGYLTCAQLFGRHMLDRGKGSIVHVGSITGFMVQPHGLAYNASKSAVATLSKGIALELGPQGVRSNVVSPGLVRTQLSEKSYSDPELYRYRTKMIPQRRVASPKDIANAVLFLASELSGYVTGQDLVVDGGFTENLMSLIPRADYTPAVLERDAED